MIAGKVWKKLSKEGIRGVINYFNGKVLKTRTRNFGLILDYLREKRGLEIGGPSSMFREGGFIPLYPVIEDLDGCNFNAYTVWEGQIKEGFTYDVGGKASGYQYITDGVDLSHIETGKYDFLLSSHSLEHIANPIKALKEWVRVIETGGMILLILPDKNFTFDHNRPYTKFEHLLWDFENNTSEKDLTHLDEILTLHDLSYDEAAGSFEDFKQRSLNNYNNRCLHHHVFDTHLLTEIFDYLNLRVLFVEVAPPYNLIIAGVKQADLGK